MSALEKKNAIYTECGWVAEVEVLEDNSGTSKLKYTLKVVKTLVVGRLGSLPDGHVFTAFADRKHIAMCGWHIDLPAAYAQGKEDNAL